MPHAPPPFTVADRALRGPRQGRALARDEEQGGKGEREGGIRGPGVGGGLSCRAACEHRGGPARGARRAGTRRVKRSARLRPRLRDVCVCVCVSASEVSSRPRPACTRRLLPTAPGPRDHCAYAPRRPARPDSALSGARRRRPRGADRAAGREDLPLGRHRLLEGRRRLVDVRRAVRRGADLPAERRQGRVARGAQGRPHGRVLRRALALRRQAAQRQRARAWSTRCSSS